ncbi:hypothetical protein METBISCDRAFT_31981 [Metschnikowia bicuspidata]|uniref:Uncharacterized protein n=1 Tax=Metschnikowia bicuspidata TaxID=27322 RepID=A0A4P9Z8D8_9ASCO|nr:hypothetical protein METBISCDRAFT_31981 [Metschnikowia bicuspidata]
MEAPEHVPALLDFIDNYFDKKTIQKYLRLIIIVCVYLSVRTCYTNWTKQRQVRRQVDLDKQEQERDTQLAEWKIKKFENEAQFFGWGKTTRRNVKRQEKALAEATAALREAHQTAYDAAEDHDIEELLE